MVTETFSLRLRNLRRAPWGWLFIPLSCLAGPFVAVAVGAAPGLAGRPGSAIGMVVGIAAGLAISAALLTRFFQWSSEPVTVELGNEQLVIQYASAKAPDTIPFASIRDYVATSYRGAVALRLIRRDGGPLLLNGKNQPMVALVVVFESRFKAYRLRLLLARPRPRR